MLKKQQAMEKEEDDPGMQLVPDSDDIDEAASRRQIHAKLAVENATITALKQKAAIAAAEANKLPTPPTARQALAETLALRRKAILDLQHVYESNNNRMRNITTT